jgi:hypothetical protein
MGDFIMGMGKEFALQAMEISEKIEIARSNGLRCCNRSRIRFSRAALFQKFRG